ncbi:MAG: metallophosphoesterase [Oscillospiraceae bacterium]|jgi:predicted MPP superfamily phosphohydrolase|nr:metallophosphoesterase [Oscillospiraceae bacterium]
MPGKREEPREKRRRSKGCLVTLILLAAVLFWLPTELYLSNNAPRTEHITVRSSRLPAAFDGFRILHLSDLHEKGFGNGNETLLRMARDAKPDVIAVTGDLIDSAEALYYAETLLPALTSIAPVYYVTGNHEWAADGKTAHAGRNRLITRLETVVWDSGAVWLDSGYDTLERGGERILLAGLCDPNGPRSEPNVHELRQRIDAEHGDSPFTVLLSHRHDLDYTGAGFDVVLTGHAHGGVVRLPFTDGLIGPDREWFPRGTSGVLSQGGVSVVVNRGLGDTYFPRFLNRPQVLVVTLSA